MFVVVLVSLTLQPTNNADMLVGHNVICFLSCLVNTPCNCFDNVVLPLPPGPVIKNDGSDFIISSTLLAV